MQSRRSNVETYQRSCSTTRCFVIYRDFLMNIWRVLSDMLYILEWLICLNYKPDDTAALPWLILMNLWSDTYVFWSEICLNSKKIRRYCRLPLARGRHRLDSGDGFRVTFFYDFWVVSTSKIFQLGKSMLSRFTVAICFSMAGVVGDEGRLLSGGTGFPAICSIEFGDLIHILIGMTTPTCGIYFMMNIII